MNSRILSDVIEEAGNAYSSGDFEKALQLYEQAVLIEPTNCILYSNRSAILFRLGRFNEAVVQADQSINLNPKWAKGYLRKGDALRDSGNLDRAVVVYCQGLAADYQNSHLLNSLIKLLSDSALNDQIYKILIFPQTSDLRRQVFMIVGLIGQYYLNQNSTSQAIPILNAALEIDCDCVKIKCATLATLSDAHYKRGNYQKAIEYLQLQLQLISETDDKDMKVCIYECIAKIALLEDNLALAVHYLKKAITSKAEKSENTDALYELLADILTQSGIYEEAKQILKLIKVKTPSSLLLSSKIAIATREIDEAIIYCNEFLQQVTDFDERAFAIILKCKCCLTKNNADIAIHLLNHAITRCPSNQPTNFTIGLFFGVLSECHLAVNQYKSAQRWAKKQLRIAITIKSETLEAEALKHLANVHEAVKDYSNALVLQKRYDKLIRGEKLDVRIASKLRLANFYEKNGLINEAETSLIERLVLVGKTAFSTLLIHAHSDLTKFYRKACNMIKRVEHFEQEKKLLEDSDSETKAEMLVLEDGGDMSFDNRDYNEASEQYEHCLMLTQEQGDLNREAEIFSKLGAAQMALYNWEEALCYYQQSIVVYQQLSDVYSMMQNFEIIAELHLRKHSHKKCLTSLRYYSTLAGFLGDEAAKLDALIKIGKTMVKEKEFRKARKVFTKALTISKEKGYKRQLALLYGYTAQCYIGMGKTQKALLQFCQQLPYLDEIDDIEGKCETLAHLIEEKCIRKDASWALRLCNNRITTSKHGPADLQILVLKESASTALRLSYEQDAQKFLEKAFTLSIQSGCTDNQEVLFLLTKIYRDSGATQKAIFILSTYLKLCNEKNLAKAETLFLIGICWLQEGEPEIAKKYIDRANNTSENQNMKQRYAIAIACYYFLTNNHEQSLVHLKQAINLSGNDENLNGSNLSKLQLQLGILEWHSKGSNSTIDTFLKFVKQEPSEPIFPAFDATCLYDLADGKFADQIAKLHWHMTRADFAEALLLVESLHADPKNDQKMITIVDKALILLHLKRVQECFDLLNDALNQTFADPNLSNEEVFLLFVSYGKKQLLNFINFLVLLCSAILSLDPLESLFTAEKYFWSKYKPQQRFQPEQFNVQKLAERIKMLHQLIVYQFQLDQFSFVWIIGEEVEIRFFGRQNSDIIDFLPLFYVNQVKMIFPFINQITDTDYESYIAKSTLLINVDRCGIDHNQHCTLFGIDASQNCPLEYPLAIGGFEDGILDEQQNQSVVEEDDLSDRIQLSSVVILNCDNILIDVAHIEEGHLATEILILSNGGNVADGLKRYLRAFLLAGVSCVICLHNTNPKIIMSFAKELLKEGSPKRCLHLLNGGKIKVYGNREYKIKFSKQADLKLNDGESEKEENEGSIEGKNRYGEQHSSTTANSQENSELLDPNEIDLKKLMKSFAAEQRKSRRRRKKKKMLQKDYWSEGEVSCRSSFSEGNTDTEAIVVDINLESS